MNREALISMAREAGGYKSAKYPDEWRMDEEDLERFAALVASAEREACANICETLELPEWPDKVRQPLAQAIRARGQA